MKKTLISILQKIHKIVTKHFFFSDSLIEEEEEVQNGRIVWAHQHDWLDELCSVR